MAQQLRPLLAAVSSSMLSRRRVGLTPHENSLPFITISRQAGAGGRTLMTSLVEALRKLDPATPPWSGYDRELIDRVVERHGLDSRRIERIEEEEPSWLLEVFEHVGSAEGRPEPTDVQVYHMVTDTIRRIARSGRAIIIGRGGVFATRDLRYGVHVRLVAPLENRIAFFAEQQGLSHEQAVLEVRRLDKQRDRFFKRFWSVDRLSPEHFDITLNTAQLSEQALVDALLPMVVAKASTVSQTVARA